MCSSFIQSLRNWIAADLEEDPTDAVPTARKITGKAQAGKDMDDYFGFEVSRHAHRLSKFDK